jgi:hypothetical protein
VNAERFVHDFLRKRIFPLVAALVLMGGPAMSGDVVLCAGPGNHCHFEIPFGANCESQHPVNQSAPQPRDGCPKGSRDLKLAVDTHRTASKLAQFTSLVMASSAIPLISERSRHDSSCARPATPRLQRSATIFLG